MEDYIPVCVSDDVKYETVACYIEISNRSITFHDSTHSFLETHDVLYLRAMAKIRLSSFTIQLNTLDSVSDTGSRSLVPTGQMIESATATSTLSSMGSVGRYSNRRQKVIPEGETHLRPIQIRVPV